MAFIFPDATGHFPVPFLDNVDVCRLCGAHVENHTLKPPPMDLTGMSRTFDMIITAMHPILAMQEERTKIDTIARIASSMIPIYQQTLEGPPELMRQRRATLVNAAIEIYNEIKRQVIL